jgi:hypothetical protein
METWGMVALSERLFSGAWIGNLSRDKRAEADAPFFCN